MFSLCIDVPKKASYYPQNIMLQFYICSHKNYYATLMLLEKLYYMKNNINFKGQAWNRPPKKCWVKGFVLPYKYHAPHFTKDSVML